MYAWGRCYGLAAGVLTIVVPMAAMAQQPPGVPSTVAPGAIDRELQKPREPVAPPPSQPLTLDVEGQAPPKNSASLTFTLRSLEVTGATALPASLLTVPYASLTGQTISVQKVYQIASEMTARYRNAGYVLSFVSVPQQTIADGHVTLQVTEGFVAAITIEGDVGRRSGLLDSMRRRVLTDRPLRNSTLERFLLLLNDLPGMMAQGVLQPSQATPGASDLVVRLRTIDVNLNASVSNRGSRLQGPVQVLGGAGFNSLFGTFDNTSLQYLQAGRASELRFYSGSHRERLTASGLDLTVSGSHSKSDTDLGLQFAENNLQTDNTQARVELSMPVQRRRDFNVTIHGAITYSDGETDSLGTVLNHDVLSALRVGANVDMTDSAGGVNLVDVEFSRGLNVFGASPYGDPLASRPGGRPDFSKLTANLARLQSLGGPVSVLLAINGQLAFSKVLLAEEFAYGGEFIGRAYDASELVGDSGIAGKVELRYTLDFKNGFGVTLYGFGEDGKVWRRITTDMTTPRSDSAVSVGGGLRFSLSRWVSGYVEAAKPTNHVIAALGDKRTRVFAGLQFNFDL